MTENAIFPQVSFPLAQALYTAWDENDPSSLYALSRMADDMQLALWQEKTAAVS